MANPQVYADFNNLDDWNRLKLDRAGTISDLNRQGLKLDDGLLLTLYMDDADDEGRPGRMLADGKVLFNQSEKSWVAAIDWDAIRHETNVAAKPVVAASQPDDSPLVRAKAPLAHGGGSPQSGARGAPVQPQMIVGMFGGSSKTKHGGRHAVASMGDDSLGWNDSGLPATPLPPGAQPRLVVVRGVMPNVEYPIYAGNNFVGWSDEQPVDIDLVDQEAPGHVWSSRQHCLITFENCRIHVEDLCSANGTYVNRQRVFPGEKRGISPGDILQIGTVQLKVKS